MHATEWEAASNGLYVNGYLENVISLICLLVSSTLWLASSTQVVSADTLASQELRVIISEVVSSYAAQYGCC